jgi:negative regulator of flagellin synthesis FlgM
VANRINNVDGSSIGTSNGTAVKGRRASSPSTANATGTDAASASSADSASSDVHVADSLQMLAGLSSAVQQTPEVDEARVANLQQAISSGQYAVDPDRIASRMLQLEQQLSEPESQ